MNTYSEIHLLLSRFITRYHDRNVKITWEWNSDCAKQIHSHGDYVPAHMGITNKLSLRGD